MPGALPSQYFRTKRSVGPLLIITRAAMLVRAFALDRTIRFACCGDQRSSQRSAGGVSRISSLYIHRQRIGQHKSLFTARSLSRREGYANGLTNLAMPTKTSIEKRLRGLGGRSPRLAPDRSELVTWSIQASPRLPRIFRPTMSDAESHTNGQRTFPPLYKSTGNESMDRLAFFHILEKLKVWLPISSRRLLWVQCPSIIASRSRSARVG